MLPSRVTPEAFVSVLREGLPSAAAMPFEVVALERGRAVLRLTTGPGDLRPGDTVAGPVLFAFADLAMFAAVMSAIGVVHQAVTTDATVHFLRPPRPGVLVARARLLKQGRRLLVGDIMIAPEADPEDPVAHAVMTYAVPTTPGAA